MFFDFFLIFYKIFKIRWTVKQFINWDERSGSQWILVSSWLWWPLVTSHHHYRSNTAAGQPLVAPPPAVASGNGFDEEGRGWSRGGGDLFSRIAIVSSRLLASWKWRADRMLDETLARRAWQPAASQTISVPGPVADDPLMGTLLTHCFRWHGGAGIPCAVSKGFSQASRAGGRGSTHVRVDESRAAKVSSAIEVWRGIECRSSVKALWKVDGSFAILAHWLCAHSLENGKHACLFERYALLCHFQQMSVLSCPVRVCSIHLFFRNLHLVSYLVPYMIWHCSVGCRLRATYRFRLLRGG